MRMRLTEEIFFNFRAFSLFKLKEISVIAVFTLTSGTSMVSNVTQAFMFGVLDKYNINFKNVSLSTIDAAAYNIKATKDLKQLNNNLLHFMCIAHLLHNCSIQIKAYCYDVIRSIASMQTITQK